MLVPAALFLSCPEPIRLPGPPDGWTRAHEVAIECLAIDQDNPRSDAALAALGEINRLRLLADAGLPAAGAWMELSPNERGDVIEFGGELYVALDRLAEANGLGDETCVCRSGDGEHTYDPNLCREYLAPDLRGGAR